MSSTVVNIIITDLIKSHATKDLPPEVLQLIFLNLEYTTLETLRLLRKEWKKVIDEGPRYLRPRFLLPVEKTQHVYLWLDRFNATYQLEAEPTAHYRDARKGEFASTKVLPITKIHPRLQPVDENDMNAGDLSILFPFTLEQMLLLPDGTWQDALIAQPPLERIELLIIDGYAQPGLPEDDIQMLVQAVPCPGVHTAWRYEGMTGRELDDVADAAMGVARVKKGVTLGRVVKELRKFFWPHQSRSRPGMGTKPLYDLSQYAEVIGLIWDVALDGGEYVAQADAHAEWEEAVEEEKAALAKVGQVSKVTIAEDGRVKKLGEGPAEGDRVVEVRGRMGKVESYGYTIDVDAVEARKVRRFS